MGRLKGEPTHDYFLNCLKHIFCCYDQKTAPIFVWYFAGL